MLQSEPLLLDLLQPHLTVASHHCAVGVGWELACLLHWGTLGDPLLVQSKAWVQSRIQPGSGLVFVVNVVDFALRCDGLFPTIRQRTTGWVHEVLLLLDWHSAGWGRLVHLEQGLTWVLPSGSLFNMIEEVSLSRGSLGHLPAGGQRHVIRDLI